MVSVELLDLNENVIFKGAVRFGTTKLYDAQSALILDAFIRELHQLTEKTTQVLKEQAGLRVSSRVLLDGYLPTMFWYLVLKRPFLLPVEMGQKDKTYCLLEALEEPDIASELHNLDLGIAWDRANNLLTIIWHEAILNGGILSGWENCQSWKEVQAWFAAGRVGSGGLSCEQLQRLAAVSSTQAVTGERAKTLGVLKRSIGFLTGVNYDDVVVFNLHTTKAIVDTVTRCRLDVGLPTPLRTSFCRFYSSDRADWAREKAAEQHMLNKRIFMPDEKLERLRKTDREKRRKMRAALHDPDVKEASLLIQKIPALLGLPSQRRGRASTRLIEKSSRNLALAIVSSYINGQGKPVEKWMTAHLTGILRRLEELTTRRSELSDITYPWLLIKNCGMNLETWAARVRQEIAGEIEYATKSD